MEIIQVSPSEAPSLQDISRKTFLDTYGDMNTPENMASYLDQHFSLSQLSKALIHHETHFYFAKSESRIVGYLKVNTGQAQTDIRDSLGLEIERIYVLSDFKGKGTGRKLCDQAVTMAKTWSKTYVWLGVWQQNKRAIQFYEKYGFRSFSKHSFVLGNDIQTDIMMKIELDHPKNH